MNPYAELVAADIGNVTTKYRNPQGQWCLEPSLVRVAPEVAQFTFTGDRVIRPLRYREGPASIDPTVPYLVGSDAEKTGSSDVPIIGTAELRVRSSAYVLLHLYAIIASLPPAMTEASILFAGGVPMSDFAAPSVVEGLKQRLRGTHRLQWGETNFVLTISKISIVPQPIGGVASLIFAHDGRIITNGMLTRMRMALDIGGGTTDYTCRIGLQAVEGMEGGVPIGIHAAAEYARQQIVRRFPQLRTLRVGRVLECLRANDYHIFVQGEPLDVTAEITAGLQQTADDILAQVLPKWQSRLPEGEVLLFGGGGATLARPIAQQLAPITRVTLLSDPIFRVVNGIERMAKHQLLQAQAIAVGEPMG